MMEDSNVLGQFLEDMEPGQLSKRTMGSDYSDVDGEKTDRRDAKDTARPVYLSGDW